MKNSLIELIRLEIAEERVNELDRSLVTSNYQFEEQKEKGIKEKYIASGIIGTISDGLTDT